VTDTIPAHLQRRHVAVPVDRSRLCPGPHDPDDPTACATCGGSGVIPLPLPTEEQVAVGAEPLPAGHPALTRETFIPDRDATGRT
jgi:hypothetical protein